MKKISKQEYYDTFIKGRKKEDIEASYKKAWEAKNFEIDNYWKRANYFWLFQVAAFTGYFTVLKTVKEVEISYIVICVGVVTSWAWYFINKGSKVWQRNWENHVDMLEDYITGPLYKRVSADKTFSVSKINELVSQFIAWIWVFIAVYYWIVNNKINYIYGSIIVIMWILLKYWVSYDRLDFIIGVLGKLKYFILKYTVIPIAIIWILLIYFNDKFCSVFELYEKLKNIEIPWVEIFLTTIVIYYILQMIFGKGRGRFGARKVSFYKRETDIED